MAAIELGRERGDFAKTFDDSLLNVVFIFEIVHDSPKHQSAFFKSFTSGRDTFVIFLLPFATML